MIELAISLINRAHNAIGTGRYDRTTVKQWLREADDILRELDVRNKSTAKSVAESLREP